jgi:Protein of unknown function (DUF3105)
VPKRSQRNRASTTTPGGTKPGPATPTDEPTLLNVVDGAGPSPKTPTPKPAAAAPRRRVAPTAPRSPLERYRNAIIGGAIVAVIAIGGIFVFLGATGPAYACETVLAPEAAASPAPDATPRLGQVTRDLGRPHVQVGENVTYDYCPPASGPHYNDSRYGPIATRAYGADDAIDPQGWIHNLEHGQMAVLYRCPEGCDEAAQSALRALQQQLPPSPLCEFPADRSVPVVRFDDLPTPYAAVVWDRVLFLDTLDTAQIATFSEQSADRGPEPQCQAAVPGATAAPSATPAP